jgi:hypothetical protein
MRSLPFKIVKQYVVDAANLHIEREADVVADGLEARVVEDRREVAARAGEIIVDADDVMPVGKQPRALQFPDGQNREFALKKPALLRTDMYLQRCPLLTAAQTSTVSQWSSASDPKQTSWAPRVKARSIVVVGPW